MTSVQKEALYQLCLKAHQNKKRKTKQKDNTNGKGTETMSYHNLGQNITLSFFQ